MISTEELLKVEYVQKEILKVSRPTIYKLIQSDDFPKIRIGRAIRIPKEGLMRWIEKQSSNVKEV